MIRHVLLVELSSGAVAGVVFPSLDAARKWEDQHPAVSVVGCVPLLRAPEVLES